MFRYSAMAQAAKKILKEHNATPLAVIARYACAYSDIRKKDWYAHSICNSALCIFAILGCNRRLSVVHTLPSHHTHLVLHRLGYQL